MLDVNLVAGLLLGAGVYILLRLKEADQWHHLWLVLAAFDLPPVVRLTALCIGADDFLNHLVEWLGGPKECSPLAFVYTRVVWPVLHHLFPQYVK
jgi:hypothetical protein